MTLYTVTIAGLQAASVTHSYQTKPKLLQDIIQRSLRDPRDDDRLPGCDDVYSGT